MNGDSIKDIVLTIPEGSTPASVGIYLRSSASVVNGSVPQTDLILAPVYAIYSAILVGKFCTPRLCYSLFDFHVHSQCSCSTTTNGFSLLNDY